MPARKALPSARVSRIPRLDPDRFAELYDSLLGEVDVMKTLQKAAEVAQVLTRAERATIFFLLEETQELQSVVTIGNVARAIRVPISPQSLAGYCATARRAFAIDDAYEDLGHVDPGLRFDRSWDAANGYRTKSVLCAPIQFRGETLGVAQVINSETGSFGAEQLELLEEMCRFAGYALYYARVCDELSSMKRLDKEKAEFMRVLVHELKSPVSASRTLAAAVKHVNGNNPAVVDVMTKIEKRMDQLLELVADVLSLSKIKQGDPIGAIDAVDLRVDTARIAEAYAAEAAAKRLEYRVALPEHEVRVRVDTKAYHLIVSNLLSNAIKYTPAGAVSLSLCARDGCAVIEVADTGIGIPQADIPSLFREFFRAANARRQGISGSGVGLAGIKSLVERFRGDLAFASEENRGSSFTVRLPLYGER